MDDTLMNLMVIKNILKCFELTFSLRVNLHKSKNGGLGVAQEELRRFAIFFEL